MRLRVSPKMSSATQSYAFFQSSATIPKAVPLAQAVVAACVLAGARVAVQFNKERSLTGYRRVYIGSLASNAPKEPTEPAVLWQLLQPGIAPRDFFRLVPTVEPA